MTDPLYDLCDTAIMGRVGTEELAGVALAARILAFGYATFVFLLFGTTAAVARSTGADDDRDASHQGIVAMWISAALGVCSIAVFALIGRPAIGWFGGTGEVADHAWRYLSVSLAGMPAFTMVLAGVGYLRGRQNTRLPLAVAAVTVSFNLILELILVFGFNFSVGASALSTVLAKWLSAGFYMALVVRSARSTGARWQPDRSVVRRQLSVGADLVVRTLVLLATFGAAQAMAARIGVTELAAHAIAFQIWIFAAYATDGLEAAGQSLVALRLGSGRRTEVAAVSRRLIQLALVVGIAFGLVILATSGLLPHIFTSDTRVLSAATATLVGVALIQPVGAIAFALDGILVGAAQQRSLAVIMVIAGGAFVLAAELPARSLASIWVAIGVFMAVRCIGGLTRLRSIY